MEAPIGASMGAMGSLLGNLDVLLAPGCRLPKMVKDGMHLLKEDLEELSAHLGELSEVEDPPLTAKCWMKEVRELSYDIEDYIDRSVRPNRPNKTSSSSKKRYVVPARANTKKRSICKISYMNIPKWHKQIANKISGFRTYVQEAIERHGRYELGSCTLKRRVVSVGPMLPTLYEETAELVIDSRTSEFIDLLANDGDQQLKTVSLVGSGCIGKTTLARVLYNKLGDQFDCRTIIRVSQKPDMKRIFRDMLSQVQGKQPPDDCKELHLIDHIRKHLQDKRYLVIIDDLWTTSIWDIINRAFPRNGRCSRIIITTQIQDIALSCCCYRSEYVFELKPLDDYHSRKLFFNRLFGSESDCPQQFKEISNKIVELCGGLPLATIIIASLLASQPVILLDLLTYIHDSLNSYFWAHSSSEGMRQVLNLSYNNLPHYLKTCLLYVSMYAEGYKICKSDMVKQWLAEGFIDRTKGRDIEKVALSYFDELISRRLIQPIRINYNNEVLFCTVHDAVRDLIAYKSAEENFIVVIDHYRKNVALSDKVRRLSLRFGDVKYAKTPANIRRSQVRSLTFFGLFECMPSITEFKLLRVLNLQLSGHGDDHTLDLTGISDLFHLRYLKVSCDVCIDLPNRMRGLEYLETLDLDTKVTAVPWDIIHLQHLSHLHLPVERDLLDWIGSMRSVSSLCSLGKLNELRDLHLTCSTPPTDHLERSMEALGSLVGGHGNLQSLALAQGSSDRKNDLVRGAPEVIISWDGFAPPLLLQRFEWLPHSCTFSRVPTWIGVLGNLCILKIAVRELRGDCVKILRGLPALTAMYLYVQTAPAKMVVFRKEGFSVLKYFKFRCSVPWLKFDVDAMPNLQKLKLGFDAHGADQHGVIPVGIEHLSGLKEISAKIGGADEPDRRSAESALSDAIRMHPGRPTVNIQYVDWMFGGEDDKNSRVQDTAKTIRGNEEHKTLQKQYEAMKNTRHCNEQHGVLRQEPREDANEHAHVRLFREPRLLISHFAHPAHELKHVTTKPFWCDGCMEPGDGFRYRCEPCDFDLHTCCALPPATLKHSLFGKSTFVFLPESPTHSHSRFCDACGYRVHGFVYHCHERDIDLHPCCAFLPERIVQNGRAFELLGKASGRCGMCEKHEPLVRCWTYRSYYDDGEPVNLHVGCLKDGYRSRNTGSNGPNVQASKPIMKSKGFEKFCKIVGVVEGVIIDMILGSRWHYYDHRGVSVTIEIFRVSTQPNG